MPITRVFNATDNAMAAVTDLKQAGFRDVSINVVEKTATSVTVDSIVKKGVSTANAATYAEAVNRGETLVIVYPPYGESGRATAILERHSPSNSGVPQATYERATMDWAAPFSHMLGWATLLHDPAPFSKLLNWPTLSNSQTPRSTFGWPLLSSKAAPFSSWLGWKLLSDNAAPLSSFLGWKVLSNNPAPLSALLGWSALAGSKAR